jgi:two-component sensor histidine kinase
MGAMPLAELAGRELGDFGIGREGRIVIDGPAVLLRAKAAIHLGMALHELAARVAAEGALSVPQGRVHLGWIVEPTDGAEQRLVIRWRETGGPAVHTPEGPDYGRDLIETGLHQQIGATDSISFGPDGVQAEIALPVSGNLVLSPPSEGE